MYKACSICGKVHPAGQMCKPHRVYNNTPERNLRNTASWHKKAQEIKAKAGYLCEICKQEGNYTYNGLEVHHIDKLKDNQAGLLKDNNLICLCVKHHKEADAGLINKAYLKILAEQRENNPPRG